MSNNDRNETEVMAYSILGGALILYLMPEYIPYVICYTIFFGSLYGIIVILKSFDDSNDFVSKEDIKYFKNRK